MADVAVFESSKHVVRVEGPIVVIDAKRGRFRRRAAVTEPMRWPADRTTVTFARTDGSGRWLATFAYEGQEVETPLASKALDELTAFAEDHLGGCTNSVAEAEAERVERRRL